MSENTNTKKMNEGSILMPSHVMPTFTTSFKKQQRLLRLHQNYHHNNTNSNNNNSNPYKHMLNNTMKLKQMISCNTDQYNNFLMNKVITNGNNSIYNNNGNNSGKNSAGNTNRNRSNTSNNTRRAVTTTGFEYGKNKNSFLADELTILNESIEYRYPKSMNEYHIEYSSPFMNHYGLNNILQEMTKGNMSVPNVNLCSNNNNHEEDKYRKISTEDLHKNPYFYKTIKSVKNNNHEIIARKINKDQPTKKSESNTTIAINHSTSKSSSPRQQQQQQQQQQQPNRSQNIMSSNGNRVYTGSFIEHIFERDKGTLSTKNTYYKGYKPSKGEIYLGRVNIATPQRVANTNDIQMNNSSGNENMNSSQDLINSFGYDNNHNNNNSKENKAILKEILLSREKPRGKSEKTEKFALYSQDDDNNNIDGQLIQNKQLISKNLSETPQSLMNTTFTRTDQSPNFKHTEPFKSIKTLIFDNIHKRSNEISMITLNSPSRIQGSKSENESNMWPRVNFRLHSMQKTTNRVFDDESNSQIMVMQRMNLRKILTKEGMNGIIKPLKLTPKTKEIKKLRLPRQFLNSKKQNGIFIPTVFNNDLLFVGNSFKKNSLVMSEKKVIEFDQKDIPANQKHNIYDIIVFPQHNHHNHQQDEDQHQQQSEFEIFKPYPKYANTTNSTMLNKPDLSFSLTGFNKHISTDTLNNVSSRMNKQIKSKSISPLKKEEKENEVINNEIEGENLGGWGTITRCSSNSLIAD